MPDAVIKRPSLIERMFLEEHDEAMEDRPVIDELSLNLAFLSSI